MPVLQRAKNQFVNRLDLMILAITVKKRFFYKIGLFSQGEKNRVVMAF